MSEPANHIKCSPDGVYGLPEFKTEYCNKKYMIYKNILPENRLGVRAALDKKFREDYENSLRGIFQRSIASFKNAAYAVKNIGINKEDPEEKADELQHLVTFLQGIMRTTLMKDDVDIYDGVALGNWLAKYEFNKDIQLLKNILIANMGRPVDEDDDNISPDNLNNIALEIMFTGSTDFSGAEKTKREMDEMSQEIFQTDDDVWNNFIQQHHPAMNRRINGGKRKKQRTYKRQNTHKKRKTRKRQKKQTTRKRQNAQKKRRTHKRR